MKNSMIKIKTFLILFIFFFITAEVRSQLLRTFDCSAFKRGEVLKYRIHYGFLDAAEAIVEIKDENKMMGDRSTLHVVGLGTSKGGFEWFFKVRDRYETYIDEKAILPWIFIRRVDEGGYIINQDLFFNPYNNTVNSNGKIFNVPENIQDMISSFYYARCLDYSNAAPGQVFNISSFVDNQVFPLQIKFVGRETIKTEVGKIRCLKFRPVLQKGRIFKHEEDLNVWITDDKNHIPIRAQAEILFGSLKMDLISYQGLANPVAKE